jgi:xanthine dehydrogenase YagS FAD-binding subunit
MRAFDYQRADSAADAMRRGSSEQARFIAGGTLLVDLLRLDVERPDVVVDLNGLGWSNVEETADGLRIGALVKNSALAYHPIIQKEFPVLSEALLSGASPQIRNMASVGGNLLQRTRCSYFSDVAVTACNKRMPGSGCAAREGQSRLHAILGGSEQCIAVHPSDMCVALLALGAVVHVEGPAGAREIPLDALHTLPGTKPDVETVLGRGELITHVRLPSQVSARRSAYVKVRDRASFAFALASAAAVLDVDGGVIRRAGLALGGVATKPWRSAEAERSLIGQPLTRAVYERAAALALAGAQPTPHNAFKLKIARAAIVRAFERAGERA